MNICERSVRISVPVSIFILYLFIILCNFRTQVLSASSRQHSIPHERVKRTPPIPFTVLNPTSFPPIGAIGPPFGQFPFRGPPSFRFDPERGRFGPPIPSGTEVFDRGFFRRPTRTFGIPRPSLGPGPGSVTRQNSRTTAPVIIETPDGSQTIFLRQSGTGTFRSIPTSRHEPSPLLRRNSVGSGPMSAILSSNPGSDSNPLPTCTSGTVLRCRPWPMGRDPATAHQCYGDCPGRTCLVNCICTCDTEQRPRIMLARSVDLTVLGDGPGRIFSVGPGINSGDLLSVPDNSLPVAGADLSVGGSDLAMGGPDLSVGGAISLASTADNRPSVDLPIVGVPISISETAASLPQIAVANVNVGTNFEPEVSFISAFDVAQAMPSTSSVASSGNIEVDLKAKGPVLEIEGRGPEIDISPSGVKAEGLTSGGLPVKEIEIRPLQDSSISSVLDQSIPAIVDVNFEVKPSLDFSNTATDLSQGPLNVGGIEATIPGNTGNEAVGLAPIAFPMTLPDPDPAPAPPIRDILADVSQLATSVTDTRREDPDFQQLDKALQALSNSNKDGIVNDVNALNSLIMAVSVVGSGGYMAGTGAANKTAVMSEILSKGSAPLNRLDLLVKDLGLTALFPGGSIDSLFGGSSGLENNGISTQDMINALLSKGKADNIGTNNANLLSAAGTGDPSQPLGVQDTIGGNIISDNENNKAANILLPSSSSIPESGAVADLEMRLQNKVKLNAKTVRNTTPSLATAVGATTKECLSKGLEIWCDPVSPWEPTPGVTKWCLLNCRDKNNCDRKRCACVCVEEKVFRVKFEKLPIKSP